MVLGKEHCIALDWHTQNGGTFGKVLAWETWTTSGNLTIKVPNKVGHAVEVGITEIVFTTDHKGKVYKEPVENTQTTRIVEAGEKIILGKYRVIGIMGVKLYTPEAKKPNIT